MFSNCLTFLNDCMQPCLIVGDINLPNVDWKHFTFGIDSNLRNSDFLAFCISNNLTQKVDFPTRDNNILDVLLIDDPRMIKNVRSSAPFGNSDHVSILFEFLL